jgi:hypothetical protein
MFAFSTRIAAVSLLLVLAQAHGQSVVSGVRGKGTSATTGDTWERHKKDRALQQCSMQNVCHKYGLKGTAMCNVVRLYESGII